MTKLSAVLSERQTSIAKAIPDNWMSAQRFTRAVLSLVQRQPKLLEADQRTLVGAVLQAAQLGLEPDPLVGETWFVPFKGNVQLIIGYKGLLKLAWRSGMLGSVAAHAVRDGDVFDYQLGTRPKITHKPAIKRGEIVAVYATAKLTTGSSQFHVMTKEEVDAVRRRSRSRDDGPWVTDYEAMALKTALRRLCKLLPTSTHIAPLARAVALDEQAEVGIDQHHGEAFGDATGEPVDAEFVEGEAAQ
jgi:recombination protein RecT